METDADLTALGRTYLQAYGPEPVSLATPDREAFEDAADERFRAELEERMARLDVSVPQLTGQR